MTAAGRCLRAHTECMLTCHDSCAPERVQQVVDLYTALTKSLIPVVDVIKFCGSIIVDFGGRLSE